jgi:hypothetical protein
MVFRRTGSDEQDDVAEEQADGLNIASGDGEDDEDDYESPFVAGENCWVCQTEPGRVGIDPTCHGAYGGDDGLNLVGYNCLDGALKDAYEKTEGIGVIAEPFGKYEFHLYYRIDELPAYGFAREDIEFVSWQMLSIGDPCSRCGEQSHFAWLTPDFVDPDLPEGDDELVFRNTEKEYERLCRTCVAAALSAKYKALKVPLLTVEVPRSAMGIMMPSGA